MELAMHVLEIAITVGGIIYSLNRDEPTQKDFAKKVNTRY